MAIRRIAAVTALSVGLLLPIAGCAGSGLVVEQQKSISDIAVLDFSKDTADHQELKAAAREADREKAAAEKAEAERIAAEEKAAKEKVEAEQKAAEVVVAEQERANTTAAQTATPVQQAPVAVTPGTPRAQTTAPTAVPAPAPVAVAPAPIASTHIHVALRGGQDVVDLCQGPVVTTTVWETTVVGEHDGCGGWAKFGNMQTGAIVTLTGQVNGTYRIGGKVVLPRLSYAYEMLPGFGGSYPPVVFQTCIPGTKTVVLTGAYPV